MSRRPVGRPVASSTTRRSAWSVGRNALVTAPTVSHSVHATAMGGRPAEVFRAHSLSTAWQGERGDGPGGWRPVGAGSQPVPSPSTSSVMAPTVSMEGGA